MVTTLAFVLGMITMGVIDVIIHVVGSARSQAARRETLDRLDRDLAAIIKKLETTPVPTARMTPAQEAAHTLAQMDRIVPQDAACGGCMNCGACQAQAEIDRASS